MFRKRGTASPVCSINLECKSLAPNDFGHGAKQTVIGC